MPSAYNRREFVTTLAGGAIAGVALPAAGATRGTRPLAGPSLSVAVLVEPGFPAIDGGGAGPADIAAALPGHRVEPLRVADLDARLASDRCDVFVNPYGSAFPDEGWPALKRYLGAGGNWLNLGGVPCAVPVERDGAGWRARERNPDRPRELGIVLACPVDTSGVKEWRASPDVPWATSLVARAGATTVWEPYWRLSSVPDISDESGSPGASEAIVRPLVFGFDAEGTAIAAPYVLVDRLEREYSGGRWVLVTSDGAVAGPDLRLLVEAAARGPSRLAVRPSYACYHEGERPAAAVTVTRFPRAAAAPFAGTCRLSVSDAGGTPLGALDVALQGTTASATATADLGAALPGPLAPGLYRLDAVVAESAGGSAAGGWELRHTTGFWVRDERLLASGAALGAGEFSLTKGGAPLPAAGTTYMASDSHRKFLLEPNPWVWDADYRAMKDAGVNIVRTGIWSGWKQLMPRPGTFDEAALRALEAWLLTARRHDIPVIFTLFAFLPETWGGENPYLDPAAIRSQRAFVGAVASRCRAMRDLAWDLINEPSFCNKDHLWSCRPNYDRFERAAWTAWLREQRPAAAPADLPPLEAFAEGAAATDDPRVPLYRRFAQATFAGWVREMRAALSAAGAGHQLVTVGQDEAGTRDSPNNLFLAPHLDFTCIHTWWLNDAVVWDEVLTRAAGRANLVEETGVMFAAHPPGVEAHWEAYARDLLERKMVLALGPGGAGFIEWVWNTNCYMPSDNEAAIGLLRADGTAKPELAALKGVAAFAARARPWLVGREAEPVLMVVPHSNMFSTRNTATDATRRAVRAMVYGCRVGLSAVSELELSAVAGVPRLVIVPAPAVLSGNAWAVLRAWARRGVNVLVTGPLDALARFRGRPSVGPAGAVRIAMGRGAVLWAPEAVELATNDAPVGALYAWALAQAGVAATLSVAGADASVLVHAAHYRSATLYTMVAGAEPVTIRVTPREGASFVQSLAPGRAALTLVSRDGARLAHYPA